MDHATQVALIRRIFALLDAGTTDLTAVPYVNPASAYTSVTQWRRERQLLFRHEPLLAGMSCEVAKPGDYLFFDGGGLPVVVVRTAQGDLNAFVALCRHRGAQIVSESGRGSGRLTCPYHGWTYDEDGQLVSRPCAEGFEGIPTAELSLKRLPVREKYGLVFVRGVPGDFDIDSLLGGSEHEIAPLRLHQYTRFGRHEMLRRMNWKLVVDTFLEAYHVPALHAETLSPMILGAPAVWDSFGRSGRMIAVRRSIHALRDRPEAEWDLFKHSVVLHFIFPNTVLIYQIDHVEVVQAFPGSEVGAARIVFTLYTPQPVADDRARRHFQANFDLLLAVSGEEDFRTAEGIQRGLEAGGQEVVIYGRNEPGLAHFHRIVTAAVSAGTTERTRLATGDRAARVAPRRRT